MNKRRCSEIETEGGKKITIGEERGSGHAPVNSNKVPSQNFGPENELSRLSQICAMLTKQAATTQQKLEALMTVNKKLTRSFDRYKEKTSLRLKEVEKSNKKFRKLGELSSGGGGAKVVFKDDSESEEEGDGLDDNIKVEASAAENLSESEGDDYDDNDDNDDDDDDGDDDDIPTPKPEEEMNIAKAFGGRCCATKAVLYFARDRSLLSCTVDGFLSFVPWSERDDYTAVDKEKKAELLEVVQNSLIKYRKSLKSKKKDVSNVYINVDTSFLILYEGKVPVTVVTFVLGAKTNRTFINLNSLYTTKKYRRRGNGTVAFNLLKEFACNNPFRPKCDTAFIWLATPRKATNFFVAPKNGCLEGWDRLAEIFSEQPFYRQGDRKCHVMLTKFFKGGYAETFMHGADHPHYEKEIVKERPIDHQSWAEYPVGSRIVISYPNVKSKATYIVTVLNYNHLDRKPYYIQYDGGNETEFIVPKRIQGLEGDVVAAPSLKATKHKGRPKGSKNKTKDPSEKSSIDQQDHQAGGHFTRAKGPAPEIKKVRAKNPKKTKVSETTSMKGGDQATVVVDGEEDGVGGGEEQEEVSHNLISMFMPGGSSSMGT